MSFERVLEEGELDLENTHELQLLRNGPIARARYRCRCHDADGERGGFHWRGGGRLRLYSWSPCAPARKGAVLLLHGMLSSHRTWSAVVDGLRREGWATYAPDLLGFGTSPWPRGADSYTMEEHVRRVESDALAELARAGHRDVHVVGFSMGAALAVELCARHMASQRAFVLPAASLTTIALPYYSSAEEARRGVAGGSGWRSRATQLTLGNPRLAWIACTLICQNRALWIALARLYDATRRLCLALARRPRPRPGAAIASHVSAVEMVEDALHHSYESVTASFRGLVEHHRLAPSALPEHLPVLALHGAADDVVSVECSRRFVADLALARGDSRLAKLRTYDARHTIAGAAAEVVLRELRAALAPHDLSRPPPGVDCV